MPDDFDLKNCRIRGNSKTVKDDNLIIETCLSRLNEVFVRYRLQNINLTPELLKNEWKNPTRRIDFHSFFNEALEEQKGDITAGTYRSNKSFGKKLKTFRPKLVFTEITADFIDSFSRCDAVYSTAYKHPETFNETPSCQTTIFQYKKFHIEWAQQVAHLYNRNQGVAWIGNKATLICNRDGYELIPQKNKDGSNMVEPVRVDGQFEERGVDAHTTNWCNCIRNRSLQTNSPIEKGAFASILAHMGKISYRSGTRVVYDPEKRKFINNPDADLLI